MLPIVHQNHEIIPSKIVCVGRNYADHAAELGNELPEQMVLFCKPNSAIGQHLRAHHGEPLHYEAELSFLVKDGKFIAVAIGLDLTKRQLQSQLKSKGLPWERAKAFNGAALFSEFVSIPSSINSLRFEFYREDTLLQQGEPSLMIFKPETILEEIQEFMLLEDGDIVMTGTPKGVGELVKGALYRGKVWERDRELVAHEWLAE